MKCYYCDTEFNGYKCPKCLAVYTIDEKENQGDIEAESTDLESIHKVVISKEDMVNADDEKLKTEEKKGANKGKALEVVLDIAGEVVGAIIESLFD